MKNVIIWRKTKLVAAYKGGMRSLVGAGVLLPSQDMKCAHLDQVFGPARSQHTPAPKAIGVSSVLGNFPGAGIGTSIHDDLHPHRNKETRHENYIK